MHSLHALPSHTVVTTLATRVVAIGLTSRPPFLAPVTAISRLNYVGTGWCGHHAIPPRLGANSFLLTLLAVLFLHRMDHTNASAGNIFALAFLAGFHFPRNARMHIPGIGAGKIQ